MNINNTNIFTPNPSKNLFKNLEEDKKEKNVENINIDKPKFILFDNVFNKNENKNKEIKLLISLFGNMIKMKIMKKNLKYHYLETQLIPKIKMKIKK